MKRASHLSQWRGGCFLSNLAVLFRRRLVSLEGIIGEVNLSHRSLVFSPAARRRGGRLSGEVPVLARRDPGIPAGQEGRGQGSQQVAVVHAARGAVRGGLSRKDKDQLTEAEPQRDEGG